MNMRLREAEVVQLVPSKSLRVRVLCMTCSMFCRLDDPRFHCQIELGDPRSIGSVVLFWIEKPPELNPSLKSS